jgi:hypothetical protein
MLYRVLVICGLVVFGIGAIRSIPVLHAAGLGLMAIVIGVRSYNTKDRRPKIELALAALALAASALVELL